MRGWGGGRGRGRGGGRESGRQGGGGALGWPSALCLFLLLATICAQTPAGPGPVNIARGLPPSAYTQSSYHSRSGPSGNAANGNRSGRFSSSNCIHTADYTNSKKNGSYRQDREPWWQVDLGRQVHVFQFRIWARDYQFTRFYPFRITVDGEECAFVAFNRRGEREINVTCSKPLYGRVVRLTRLSKSWDFVLNFCEFEIFVCNPGYYGMNCSLRCSRNCASDGCFMNDGKCLECRTNRYGDACQQRCSRNNSRCTSCQRDDGLCTACFGMLEPPDCTECPDGYYLRTQYGHYCSECHGTCLNGTTCDNVTGLCPVCPPGKRGLYCSNFCERKTYGQNCSQHCGHCQWNMACDVVDGSCKGCHPGWQMPQCQKECKNGSYGVGCTKTCGHCLGGVPCDKETGHCQHCEAGWLSPRCQEPCPDGRYGVDCRDKCGSCLNNLPCNKTNGYCPCPVGKQPPLCDRDCLDQTYGDGCQEKCGYCREGSACDVVTGHCPSGCQPGWTDHPNASVNHCQTACPTGQYGKQCNQKCGQCGGSSDCHHVTGQCPQGCAQGFSGILCQEEKPSERRSVKLHIIIGVLATVLALVLIVVMAFVCRQQRRKRTSTAGVSRPNADTEQLTLRNRQQPEDGEDRHYSVVDIPSPSAEEENEEGVYSEVCVPASHFPRGPATRQKTSAATSAMSSAGDRDQRTKSLDRQGKSSGKSPSQAAAKPIKSTPNSGTSNAGPMKTASRPQDPEVKDGASGKRSEPDPVDLASIFSSHSPATQPGDAEDCPPLYTSCYSAATYDRSAVYQNKGDVVVYSPLQSSIYEI